MRIVLACWGSYGDLFPYLGLAQELQSRGHTPVVATIPFHADIVRSRGFEYARLRPDVNPDDSALIARVLDPARGSEVVVREMVMPGLRDQYEDLAAAIEGADGFVSHPVTFAAPVLGDRTGLPWVSSVLSPVSFFSVHDFPVLPVLPAARHLRALGTWTSRALLAMARRATRSWTAPVRELRATLGLPDRGEPVLEGQFSPFGTIALFSPLFGPPQSDWPAGARATGFVFDNRAIAMPQEVSAFLDAGAPPVVFTLGSSAVGSPGAFYEESVRAARLAGRRALLLIGREENRPASATGADVYAALSAPHDEVFPRAAAIVHHGGVGTTAQALRSGRPMLVTPFAHDQPDNAYRAAALGCGRVCDPRRYSAPIVAKHLRALVEDQAYASSAASVGEKIRAEHGAEAAADAVIDAMRGKS